MKFKLRKLLHKITNKLGYYLINQDGSDDLIVLQKYLDSVEDLTLEDKLKLLDIEPTERTVELISDIDISKLKYYKRHDNSVSLHTEEYFVNTHFIELLYREKYRNRKLV